MKKVLFALAVMLCMPLTSQAGWVYTFDFGNPNILGNGTVASPYATLTLDDSTTDPLLASNTVRFQLAVAGNNDALFSKFAFNLNGVAVTDLTLTNISGTGPGNPANWNLFTQNNGVPMDGFGKFDVGVGPSSANQRIDSLTFDLQFTDPSDARISSVFAFNSGAGNPPGSFSYALEYFPASGETGFVGVHDNTIATPEPSSIAMVLAGGITFGLARLRKRKTCKPTN